MDNGRDLIDMVCQGFESPPAPAKDPQGSTCNGKHSHSNRNSKTKPGRKDDADSGSGSCSDDDDDDDDEEFYSFGEFRLLILRRGPDIVTVATLRLDIMCLALQFHKTGM